MNKWIRLIGGIESCVVFKHSVNNAGEVGDGPDQGHSGGADSVPPAPSLVESDNYQTLAIRLPVQLISK